MYLFFMNVDCKEKYPFHTQKRIIKKLYKANPSKILEPDMMLIEFDKPFVIIPDVVEPACLPEKGYMCLVCKNS